MDPETLILRSRVRVFRPCRQRRRQMGILVRDPSKVQQAQVIPWVEQSLGKPLSQVRTHVRGLPFAKQGQGGWNDKRILSTQIRGSHASNNEWWRTPREVSTSNPSRRLQFVILAPCPCPFRPKPLPFSSQPYAYLARDGILNEYYVKRYLGAAHTKAVP